jgi:[calcium/calmodulin-dependent protein kinase] kinase
MKEIAILKKLRHKNIIKLVEIMNDLDTGKMYIVMEFAGKGPIMNFDESTGEFTINDHYINKNKSDPNNFSEDEIKDLLRDLLSGLNYCMYIPFFLNLSTPTRNSP